MPERTLILFGSEHHGLEHEEILLCDQLIHIPTSPTYGALNLAMSAGIVAFEWTRQHAVGVYASGTASGEAPTGSEDPGSAVLRKKTFEKIIRAAEEVGFLHSQHPYKLELGLKRVFARAQLTQNELQWVHGLFDQILTAQKSKLKLNMYVE
jgi:tRNA C32,U32 (ribose-2'-O)-methylase TrmJ